MEVVGVSQVGHSAGVLARPSALRAAPLPRAQGKLKKSFQKGIRIGSSGVTLSVLALDHMKPAQLKQLSHLCFFLGFASIAGSIAIWLLTGGQVAETQAHAERFGIFVGLWAPTFFILSNRFDRYAEKAA